MNIAIALAALTAVATTLGGFLAIKVKDRSSKRQAHRLQLQEAAQLPS